MSRPAPVNSTSTPGSISRRSGRTSRPLEEGTGARSSSTGGPDTKREGNGGMSVTTPRNTATVPPSASPWKHPDELPFVLREDWTQELMIDYLAKKSFTIPPNSYRSKDPFFTITPRNGQHVVIPRRYRIPILFLAKFQWDSIRIVLTASDPVTDWNICKYEIIHISRVCQHFFDAARGAAEVKGPGALSRTWRCPLMDRVLVRFWNHWFLSEESWLKAFYKEFGEEDYEQDILEKDWQRWALKGHKGFQLTKEEITDGISADQFMDGLTKTYSGWTWAISTPSDTSVQVSEPKETLGQAPDVDLGPSSSSISITAVPTAPEISKLTEEQLEQLIASGSSDIIPPTASTQAPEPPSQVISPAVSEPSASQVALTAEIPKTTPSVVLPVPTVMREEVSDANVGNKRARDDTDVDVNKQIKKAKKKSNSPELPPSSPAVSVVTQGSTLPTEAKASAVHHSQSSCELSSSIDLNDGEASVRQTVNSTAVPASAIASATIGQQESSLASTVPTVLPSVRKRADSVESTDSSISVDSPLSDFSLSSRCVSNTPPPQPLPATISMQSATANGVPTEASNSVTLPKSATPTAPGNAVPVSVHTPLPITPIPPFLPDDLGPASIDRDMSVSPIVRSTASSGARSAITGTVLARLPDTQFESNGAATTSNGRSLGSTASLSRRSVPTGAPVPTYQTQHTSAQSYLSYLCNSSAVPPSFIPSQTMTPDGMFTSVHPLPTLFRTPDQAASSPVPIYSQISNPPSAPGQEQHSDHSVLHPVLQKSPHLPPDNDARNALLTGADLNPMNLTGLANRSSFSTISAFAQAGLPDPHEKTQKLHASLLVRDLLDFMQTSSWKRHQSHVQGERGLVVDARTRHLVLDGDHAMSVDQRFVILKNSVLSIVNRFDGMKADQLETEIADVDSKLKHIFDETWTALNLPCREEWPFQRTTRDVDVQVTPVDVLAPAKASVRDAGVQASVEPTRHLLESVSIQTEDIATNTAAPLPRPSVSPDATMIDLTGSTKNDNTPENDISVKAAMTSIVDMMQEFVENSKNNKEQEREHSAESSVLATIMTEFKAMKDDVKKAQQMNREELQAANELHRDEVKALKEELRHREQQRQAELDALKGQHRAEIETLRGTIRMMEKERERLSASEDEVTRIQPQELLDLRRRISTLESLTRSPGFPSDHVMASPPLSAASTARSEPLTAAPKMQAHPLSHLIAIDSDDTPIHSPRTHMASMREASISKPGTPLPSDRASVSRRDSMDVVDEPNIPMPVKTQRKPYMFAPRPSAG